MSPETWKIHICASNGPGNPSHRGTGSGVSVRLARVTMVIVLPLWASVSSLGNRDNNPCSASLAGLLWDSNELMLQEVQSAGSVWVVLTQSRREREKKMTLGPWRLG